MAMATGRLGSWMALSSIASMARRVWSRLSRGFWYIPPPPVLCSIFVVHTAAHSSRTPDGTPWIVASGGIMDQRAHAAAHPHWASTTLHDPVHQPATCHDPWGWV